MYRHLALPPGINETKKNVFDVGLPYHGFGGSSTAAGEKPWVVFWGVPFHNFDMVYADVPEFIRRTNQCLEYVRRQCEGCELIYKPHPSETDESSLLDLAGFRVLPEKTVAEFFILKNFSKIRRVFSTYSSAAMTSAKLGVDAHIFLPVIEGALTEANRSGNREYFKRMHPEFFIGDLDRPFRERATVPSGAPDPELSRRLMELLGRDHRGTAWFVLGDPGSLTSVICLARLVKQLSPEKKTGLVVERHHRWGVMDMGEVRGFFDEMLVYPRLIASLRPRKIWRQVATAAVLRKAPIRQGDVLIGFNYTSFVENCLLSYFPDIPSAAFIKKETLEFCYGPKAPSFFTTYFSRPGNLFHEKVIQPLLGLVPTVFLEDPVRVANFDRYMVPVNDVYDQVYVY